MKRRNEMMVSTDKTFLQFIPYTNFGLWDVKRYTFSDSLNFDNVVSLGEILSPYKKVVSKETMIKNKWQIISKINFGGELFLREFEKIETYKGKLNLVPENSIIYSKINVRHGCIYYHPKGQSPFGVSSEYPVYTFDDTKISGKFLHLLLRCERFKQLLNTKTTGISKARVKTNEFLNIQIPLPSLEEQNRLVKDYSTDMHDVEELKQQANDLEKEIERYLSKTLGIEYFQKKMRKVGSFLKLTAFKELSKWGVEMNSGKRMSLKYDYPIKKIFEICSVGSGGTPRRDRKEFYQGNIPWIKTSEVVNDVIYDTEEKITEEAIDNSSAKIYPKGSLIIAMYGQGATRGRTAKLGVDSATNQACAVLYNIDESKINVDYFWIYLINEYERLRSLASGNNQPNLNAEKIRNYDVIIPPFLIQSKIVSYILGKDGIKAQIKYLYEKIDKKKRDALKEFEGKIFE